MILSRREVAICLWDWEGAEMARYLESTSSWSWSARPLVPFFRTGSAISMLGVEDGRRARGAGIGDWRSSLGRTAASSPGLVELGVCAGNRFRTSTSLGSTSSTHNGGGELRADALRLPFLSAFFLASRGEGTGLSSARPGCRRDWLAG